MDSKVELIKKFEDKSRKQIKGFVVDYWGSKIDVNYYTHLKEGVLGLPIPSDGILHEDIEYLGTAYALDTASKSSFVCMELGAGFGPWIVRSALIAIRLGIQNIYIVGVEADKQHYVWMKEHVSNNLNKLKSIKVKLFNKAVSEKEKYMFFPRIENPKVDWGASSSINETSHDYRGLKSDFLKIKAVPLKSLIKKYRCVDLIHVDIQGSEYNVLKSSISELNKRVRVLVVGTHSRKIEGNLLYLFYKHGWVLIDEQVCQYKYNKDALSIEAMTVVDGTQIWLNPRFKNA